MADLRAPKKAEKIKPVEESIVEDLQRLKIGKQSK